MRVFVRASIVFVGAIVGCSGGETATSPLDASTVATDASTPDSSVDAASMDAATTPDATSAPDASVDASSTNDASTDSSSPLDAAVDAAQPGPHCQGLAPTCGASSDQDCCASTVVSGGSFQRDNGASSATVSDFRLDVYEVVAGRFKAFVDGYPANMPVAGSGKNPNNGADTGWSAAWNNAGGLLPTKAALIAAVQCTGYATYSRAENLPMNCITWYEAYAFCIWDGGRLPTEAEWNYAAAGGSDQRPFPWSTSTSDLTIDATYANYAPSADYTRAGSKSTKGDGRWHQADMAGNVWEWTQDWYAAYPTTCMNCANLAPVSSNMYRIMRGGSVGDTATPFEETTYRNYQLPTFRSDDVIGVRCARNP